MQQLGAPGFWHVIARYGYAQRKDQGDAFVQVRRTWGPLGFVASDIGLWYP